MQHQHQPKQLPIEPAFLREWQIIGSTSKNIPALLPIGRTTFLNRVKSGEYPKPIKLGSRSVAWRVEDIRKLIEKIGAK